MLHSARTKIVATLGPACGSVPQVARLIQLGVDVFRLNMAHGDRQRHQAMLDTVMAARQETAIDVGILVDLAGPKIRLGDLFGADLELATGDQVEFIKGDRPASSHELTCTYGPLVDELEVEPFIGAVYFITHHHVAHPMCMRSNLMLAASFGHHLCQGESL